ncbi:MAG: 2TM domain-containing protein [Robiginitalea sp.]|jgi:two-component system LytT family sensor kinase
MKHFEEQQRYARARERVARIKGFYSNLFSYLFVIPILLWINLRTTNFLWVLFPALGWGFGLLMHGMEAFGYNPFLGRDWESRKIRELMERENQTWV